LPGILGTRAEDIGERLFTARDISARTHIIEQFFRTSRIDVSLPKESFLSLAGIVNTSRGTIRVEDLARQAKTTRRTIERIFLDHTGLTPKTFIRMVRFQHVLASLRQPGSYRSLADLACDHGYTDQSHFIRDFKALAKRLPSSV
jgi:AraC-like DNA-binding protein